MAAPAFLVLAVVPGVFWLWLFARKGSYRPEPRRVLALTFTLGMVAVLPAALIETALIRDSLSGVRVGHAHLGRTAAALFLVVGPVEEAAKFLVVRLAPYRSGYFEEPMDGLVYGAAASLGFASAENFFYMLQYGAGIIALRGPLSTLAHLVFGSFWGYALGQGRTKAGGGLAVALGLGAAALLHGVFDLAVVAAGQGGLLAGLALIAAGGVWTVRRFDWAQRVSPFRYRRNYPLVECPACQRPSRAFFRFCPWCGTAVARRSGPLLCGHCNTRNRPDAAFCTQCGDRFER